MKQYEKLNHENEKLQERSSASTAYNNKRKKRLCCIKRSNESGKYEKQARHGIMSKSNKSFDRDQGRRFSSSTSSSSYSSRRGTTATKCTTPTSSRKVTDQENQHKAIDSCRNRYEYRSPSTEYRRKPVRSSLRCKRSGENSYRNRRVRSKRIE